MRNTHPFVSRCVLPVEMALKDGPGEPWFKSDDGSITFGAYAEREEREVLLQQLTHQLVHAGQRNNFRDTFIGRSLADWPYEHFGPLGWFAVTLLAAARR
jgi:hypothetical protein